MMFARTMLSRCIMATLNLPPGGTGNAEYIDTYNDGGASTSATLGTHQTGDVFIAWAVRDGSSTAPSLASGWTDIASGGSNSLAYRLSWKVAASGAETSGTHTNATSLQIVHVRPTSGWTPTIGATSTALSSSATNISCPALTFQNTNDTSLAFAFYANRSADITNLTAAPSGMTLCETNQDANETSAVYRTSSTSSGLTTQTTTFGGTPSAARWFVVELKLANAVELLDPTGFSCTLNVADIDLAWTDTNSGTTTYYIEYSTNAGSSWTELTTTAAGAETYTMTAPAAATYDFRIRAQLGVAASNFVAGDTVIVSGESGDWQLATGHWVPRKTNMRIVHPRPDAETNAYAAHRNAYPGMPYSTYVAIKGGAYPYFFELTTAPAGMTIGAQLTTVGGVQVADSTYARIYWANPTAGTHTVVVNVYDQDYNRGGSPSSVATATFDVVCATTRYVFIDPVDGSDSGTGAIDDPFLTINKLHGGSSSTSTYNGKIVVLREGTHDVDGMSTNGNRYAMISGGAPVVFQGYPGENAILNLYQGHFVINSGSADMQFKDLTIQAAGDWTDTQYFFAAVAATNRHSWFNCTFTNFYGGTGSSTDNQSVMYYSNSGCNDIAILHCTYTGRMGSIADFYNVQYVVFALNTGADLNTSSEINDSNRQELIYLKDSCRDVSVYANTFVSGMTNVAHGSFVGCGGQNNGGADYSFNNIEICYNKLAMFEYASLRGFYEYGAGPVGAVYGYRNSCLGNITDFVDTHNVGPSPNVWENNVAVGGISGMYSATLTDNTTGASTLDSNANLSGATRTSYLGIRGAEVA